MPDRTPSIAESRSRPVRVLKFGGTSISSADVLAVARTAAPSLGA